VGVELGEDVVDVEHELGAVLDQAIGSGAGAAGDVAWDSEDIAALLGGEARGDERTAVGQYTYFITSKPARTAVPVPRRHRHRHRIKGDQNDRTVAIPALSVATKTASASAAYRKT